MRCSLLLRLLFATLLTTLSGLSYAIAVNPLPTPLKQLRALTAQEQSIESLLKKYHAAYDAKDADAMRTMISGPREFTQIESGSLDSGWPAYVYKHLSLEFDAFNDLKHEIDLVSLDHLGQLAYAVYRTTLSLTFQGTPQVIEQLASAVLVNHRGHWHIRHIHTSSADEASTSLDAQVHMMDHPMRDISGDGPRPRVKLHASADAKGGWNIHIAVSNFTFAPQKSGDAHAPGEGHAHLFVDGKKVARVYGNWFHLDPLPPGAHTLKVTLNGNDHSMFMHKGRPVSGSIDIVQAAVVEQDERVKSMKMPSDMSMPEHTMDMDP